MADTMLIATLRFSNLDPIGLVSVVAFLVVLVLAIPASPLMGNTIARRQCAFAVSLVLFLIVATEMHLGYFWHSFSVDRYFSGGYRRTGMSMSHEAGYGIFVVAGFFFALVNFGARARNNRIVGLLGTLYFGVVYAFLIAKWGSSDDATQPLAIGVFVVGWLIVVLLYLRFARRETDANGDRPEVSAYQFTLRGFFSIMLALGMFLGLYGVIHNRMVESNRRTAEWKTSYDEWPDRIFMLATCGSDGPLGNRGEDIALQLDGDSVSYLKTFSLDFQTVDSSEAVVFWLSSETIFWLSSQDGWHNDSGTTLDIKPDWHAWIAEWVGNKPWRLIDRDEDGWPELTMDTRAFGPVVFSLEDGELVGWEMEPDPTTGRRKGYVLGDSGRERFKVIEGPPTP